MKETPEFENLESRVRQRIEELARQEGMAPQDIESDICTFAELLEGGDEDVKPYFEELAERLGITLREMLAYAETRGEV